MTLGLGKIANSTEFVRMKGPSGKGYAEMAIQRADAEDLTPSQEVSALDLFDIIFLEWFSHEMIVKVAAFACFETIKIIFLLPGPRPREGATEHLTPPSKFSKKYLVVITTALAYFKTIKIFACCCFITIANVGLTAFRDLSLQAEKRCTEFDCKLIPASLIIAFVVFYKKWRLRIGTLG